MKVEAIKPKKKFEPVVIQITFEDEHEILGTHGFINNFIFQRRMSLDPVSICIKEQLRSLGY